MTGHRVEHFPGWDCHGLPIEQKAIKSSNISTSASSCSGDALELRKNCASFAEQAIARQHSDMKDWGLLQDPDRQYRTMDKSYEANQLRVFAKFVERGLVYSALRPVYWSPSSKTALAEAELEYRDEHNVTSLYVSYRLNSKISDKPVYLVVWTTTPWTLPANKAVAVNSQLEYNLVENEGKIYILSDNALALFPSGKVLSKIKGQQFLGLSYVNTVGETCPILDGSFVTAESGTGLVHLAPAYGMEDHLLCKSHGILPNDILTDDGRYSNDAPLGLGGMSITDHVGIVEKLKPFHDVMVPKIISHRYPIDWRTKEPVIQRATRQLFVNTAKIESELLQALEKVEFYPPSGKARLAKMLQSRQEWCISRQRAWGVPIPMLKKQGHEEPVFDPDIIRCAADIVEQEGTDTWWSLPVSNLIPKNHHLQGQVDTLSKGTDTLDVWFDSGTSWSLHSQRPADVYLEGGDQFRGWFQSSFITSVATTGAPPFKRVISHGFVVDAEGAKMSKSVGNVIAPNQIIKTCGPSTAYGNDLLRAWVASSDWTGDSSIGPDILRSVADVQQKIRNTCRFLLGNLSDFSQDESIQAEKMWTIDKAMISRTDELVGQVREAYNSYNHNRVMKLINQFCVEDLSAFYFDLVKDRLYSEKPDSVERRSIQTTLSHVLENLLRLMAPVLPFLAEEVHDVRYNDGTSIFQKTLPSPKTPDTNTFHELYQTRKQFRQQFSKPEKSKISVSSERNFLPKEELKELLSVAELSFEPVVASTADDIVLAGSFKICSVAPTDLHKCPRCWMYYSTDTDTLCHRCDHVLHKELVASGTNIK